MPSSISTLGWTLANLGPAPTTYSFPSSCTNAKYEIASSATPDVAHWQDTCPDINNQFSSTECYDLPTDSALAAAYPTNYQIQPFYSPGPKCPSGYKTVGAMSHNTASGEGQPSISTSGVFKDHPSISIPGGDGTWIYGAQDVWEALLDPDETLVACCPSTMTVGPNGGCYTALPSITPSVGCAYQYDFADGADSIVELDVVTTTFPINGTMTSGEVIIEPTTSDTDTGSWTPTTATFLESEMETLMAVSAQGPMYIVHRPTDLVGEKDGDDDNAAVRLRMGQGYWGQIGGITGILGVSVLAGMALVLPW